MLNWIYYPLCDEPPVIAAKVAAAFEHHAQDIDSATHAKQDSNEVLSKIASSLESIGFRVERSKKQKDKIQIPVLFGERGHPRKTFEADAFCADERFVIEVEAGRACTNYQFLKDMFEACMMHGVDYLAVAVRNDYRGSDDYSTVVKFIHTLYASSRMQLPLKGIMIVGY